MNAKTDNLKQPKASVSSAPNKNRSCTAHHELNEWQIEQYRQAVEENKWYMGERLNREISWEEAEYDFLEKGYYGCAPKWRMEFCAHRCSHFPNCKLGQLFVKK